MAETPEKYTVGNIVAIFAAALVGLGLAFYAVFGDGGGRIGRNWEAFAIMGVAGAVMCGWYAVKGIRSRQR